MQKNLLRPFQELHSPPKQLFFRGDTSLLESNKIKIAIVGSRLQSRYGFVSMEVFFDDEVFKNSIIITGGAYGTDIQAVKMALKYKIPLIVIIASGVQNYTPKRYAYLFETIPDHVLLISENPDYYVPNKYDFVKRNRLIAALADIIYINEAAIDSGSLHTADFGLELGKEVCCLPGRINDQTFLGCLKLISNGAKPILDSEQFKEFIQDQSRLNLFGNS